MYLEYSPTAIIHYLLSTGRLTFEEVFSGEAVLVPMGRLNSTFKIFRGGSPYLFFKQAAPQSDSSTSGVAREAAFLLAAAREPGLGEFLPRLVEHDGARRILLLELYEAGDPTLLPPLEGLAALARALAGLHVHGAGLQAMVEGSSVRFSHWTLQVDRKPRMRHQNQGQKELYGLLLRNEALVEALAGFEPLWEYEGVIHADAKWDNCIFAPSSGAEPAALRLADWESVRVGDFAWDVAGIFQDLWTRWIASMPLDASSTPDPESAAISFQDVTEAARVFWQTYRAHAGLDAAGAERRLAKAIRFAAARMVQTASEQSGQLGYVGYSPLALMQFAHNLATRPEEARAELLCFPA